MIFFYSAKVWGPENGRPVLALHGWLDNAGSFETLAPLLPPDLRLVCLDMGGNYICFIQIIQVQTNKLIK